MSSNKAGLANALQVGRRLVHPSWFAELDDDDMLLPGALASCASRRSCRAPRHDCVVSNGYRRCYGDDTLNISDMKAVERDPIRAFWDFNWLLPGSYLCRTDRVGPHLFDGMPESLECSYIALRLAISYRIKFLQPPTVIWNQHTPESLSSPGTSSYLNRGLMSVCSRSTCPRTHDRRYQRITWNFHSASDLYLHEGTDSRRGAGTCDPSFVEAGIDTSPTHGSCCGQCSFPEENRSVTPAKVLVLAIDAANPALLEQWAADGTLPNLRR